MSPPSQGPAHREDPQLKDRLNQIAEKITSQAFLSGQGLGNEIGFWIFDYPPKHELQVREYLTFLEGVLARQHSDLTVDHVNLLRVLRDVVEAGDVQPESLALRELTEHAADGDELVARQSIRVLHLLLAHIINAVAMQPEAVAAVGPVDERLDALADVFGELLEEDF